MSETTTNQESTGCPEPAASSTRRAPGAVAGAAIVTAGSRGIGAGAARQLLASGWRVALAARTEAGLREICAESVSGDALIITPVEAHHMAAKGIARLGSPADIGQASSFLLSPAAGWVHGVALDVDGGETKGI